jgi:hypothetical protein
MGLSDVIESNYIQLFANLDYLYNNVKTELELSIARNGVQENQ